MRREMESLRKERVSADELALAKESLINSFVFGFADSHEVVSQSMRLAFYGYPEDYLVRYRDRIAAVDADAVLEVAQRRLLPGQQTLFLVGNPDRPDLLSDQLGMPLKTISPP
jgi:zinc protease